MPEDSHAHMHLDSSERGVRFEYAFEAAVKRTILELENDRRLNFHQSRKPLFMGIE